MKQRLKTWFFGLASRLAYGLLVPLYEPVARVYADGEWHTWRQEAYTVLKELTAASAGRGQGRADTLTRVLEVGCGSGALLADMLADGTQAVGVDSSPHMVRATRRRLHRLGLPQSVILADAGRLPFPAGRFEAILLTFPTEYAFRVPTWQAFHRVLAPGGWVIWIDTGALRNPSLPARLLQRLLAPPPQMVDVLAGLAGDLTSVGFSGSWRTLELPRSRVQVLVARVEKVLDRGAVG